MRGLSYVASAAVVICHLSPCCVPASGQLRPAAIGAAIDAWIVNAEREIVPAAEAMPDTLYAFAPSASIGEFTGVRTFAQQVKHLAANNYWMAAMIRQRPYTDDMARERGPDSVATKAQIMRYLTGSFAALHEAAGSITDANVVRPIATPSEWQHTRLSLAMDAVAHSYDHYGQMVEYLRMNGIVPPASRKVR